MKIESINDNPQFIETVAGWIYKEFIENIRQDIKLENIVQKYSTLKTNTIPCALVAVENDICLGTVSLVANDLKARGDLTPWLGALYINKEFRNKGIAKSLINEVTALAKGLGYDRIYLRTEHASGYYKKLGWHSVYKTIDGYNLETEVFAKQL